MAWFDTILRSRVPILEKKLTWFRYNNDTDGELEDYPVIGSVPMKIDSNGVATIRTDTDDILSKNNGIFDAFYKQRFVQPYTLFDGKQLVDRSNVVWVSSTSGTGASSSHNSNDSTVELDVSATTAGSILTRTRQRFGYQAGKSQFIALTAVMGSIGTGLTARLGYYDTNDGVYFQNVEGTVSVGLRTSTSGSPVDTTVAQSNWNLDKMDGTGSSGITIDFTKAQIYFFDFEWLGVGAVRFGLFYNGMPYYVHEISNANTLTTTYMKSPNLPISYELINSGTSEAHTMKQICSTVISEGGAELLGVTLSKRSATAGITNPSTTYFKPLVAYRLKSGNSGSIVKPFSASVISSSSSDFEYKIVINPTLNSGSFSNWTSVSNTGVEYDTTSTPDIEADGDLIVLAHGIVSTSLDSINLSSEIPSDIWIGFDETDTADILCLCVRQISGVNETYHGTLSIRELA